MVIRRGEYFYDNLLWNNRIRTHLYQDGFNMVPVVLLEEKNPYGLKIGEESIKIYVDDYFRVNGTIRNKIKEDISYKLFLHKTTWKIIREFEVALNSFVFQIEKGELTGLEWTSICEQHVKLLSLLEMNFCLPTQWYTDNLLALTEKAGSDIRYTFNELSYSEVMPYTLQIRISKLKLCLKWYEGTFSVQDCLGYINTTGFMDKSIFKENDLTAEQVIATIKEMCLENSIQEIEHELEAIKKSRVLAKKNYLEKLSTVALFAEKVNTNCETSLNLMLALSIVSLAATEEEYRHILQEKFFYYMFKLLRNLELPPDTTSIEEVAKELRRRKVNIYAR
jgi:hypothetical protein